jgi:EmrB/QacA subfamily drug resistance transporter
MTVNPTVATQRPFWPKWAPLIAVCLAMFIVAVDSTMMTVAISAIVKELNTNVSTIQAAISFYSLVMASLMITGGKLGDLLGTKNMFIAGILLYGVGTLTAALSPTVGILILGWSVIEGIAAALIIPLAMTIIMANYQGQQRAFGFGLLGGFQATASAVGPILGGFLTTYFSWHWGFGLQVIVVMLILLLVKYIQESEIPPAGSLDWVGTLLSAAGLFAIVLGFMLGGYYGWWTDKRPFAIAGVTLNPFGLSIVPLLFLIGFFLLDGFFHWQIRREEQGKTPLIRLQLLGNRRFVAGFLTDALQSLVLAAMMFIIPLYLQSVLGYSAVESGLAILPLSAGIFVCAMATPGLSRKVQPRYLVQIGIVLMGLGVLLYRNVISTQMTVEQMLLPFLVFGAGTGIMLAQITNITLSAVHPEEGNEASGINNTLKELGTSLGTAIVGSVLLTSVYSGIASGIDDVALLDLDALQTDQLAIELEDAFQTFTPAEEQAFIAELPPAVQTQLDDITDKAIVAAKKSSLMFTFGFAVVALGVSTFIGKGRRESGL